MIIVCQCIDVSRLNTVDSGIRSENRMGFGMAHTCCQNARGKRLNNPTPSIQINLAPRKKSISPPLYSTTTTRIYFYFLPSKTRFKLSQTTFGLCAASKPVHTPFVL